MSNGHEDGIKGVDLGCGLIRVGARPTGIGRKYTYICIVAGLLVYILYYDSAQYEYIPG